MEIWWGTEQKKCARFKAGNTLEKWGSATEAEVAVTTYNDAKHVAKHAVWLASSMYINPDPQSIPQDEKQQGSWPIWHHSLF